MEDLLIQLLESFEFPVIRQGSLSEGEDYPESFFTFWNNSTIDSTFYDNAEHSEISDFDVNFYSTDPELVYEKLREAKKLLKTNGFICYDSGHDLMSDEPTHIGRGISVLYNNF